MRKQWDCLPQWCAAYSEPRHDALFDYPMTRRQATRNDRLFEPLIYGLVGGLRGNREDPPVGVFSGHYLVDHPI